MSSRCAHTSLCTVSMEPVEQVQQKLSQDMLQLLNELYLQLIPRYKLLSEEYQKALTRASNARRKKDFPSKEHWQSPLCVQPTDRALLVGPQSGVVFHKRRTVEHKGS